MATAHSLNAVADRIDRWGQKLLLSDEAFDELAMKAKRLSREDPSRYKFQLIALGSVGYAYILLIFLIFVSLIWWLVVLLSSMRGGTYVLFKLLLLVGIPAWAIARSMWLVFPAPDGIEISRQEAPALFELIDELSERIGTRVDRVVVDTEFNAAITQVPRLGLFGFHQNYLIIGLPLIQSMSREHFKSILAHELGHLSGNHSKSSAWAYSLRIRWSKVLSLMRDESPLAYALFYLFFCWYSPRFTAYSMVKVREQETQADLDAALLTSPETIAEALAITHLKGRWYSEVMNDCWKNVYHSARPPDNFHHQVVAEMRALPEMNQLPKSQPDNMELWLEDALVEKTVGSDSHPCFKERIESLERLGDYSDIANGAKRILDRWSPSPSASDVLLASKAEELTTSFDIKFSEEMAEYWEQAHEQASEEKREFEDLMKQDEEGKDLSVKDLNMLAYYTGKIEGDEKALPFYQRVLERAPDDSQANFYIGSHLLERRDGRGIEHLKKSMKGKFEIVESACKMIMQFLERSGRLDEIPEYEQKLETHYKYIDLAILERQGITEQDALEPHDAVDDWINSWRSWFASIDAIERVYMVKKYVKYFPDTSYYAVGVVLRKSVEKEVLAYTLLAYMGQDQFCITIFDAFNKKLRERMEQVENSIIYERNEHMHLATQ